MTKAEPIAFYLVKAQWKSGRTHLWDGDSWHIDRHLKQLLLELPDTVTIERKETPHGSAN